MTCLLSTLRITGLLYLDIIITPFITLQNTDIAIYYKYTDRFTEIMAI